MIFVSLLYECCSGRVWQMKHTRLWVKMLQQKHFLTRCNLFGMKLMRVAIYIILTLKKNEKYLSQSSV